jgi:hypothetical protein
MSGFLGVYRQDGAAFDERVLRGILQRLRFRGPDAQNIFVERDFASCFSFLESFSMATPARFVPSPCESPQNTVNGRSSRHLLLPGARFSMILKRNAHRSGLALPGEPVVPKAVGRNRAGVRRSSPGARANSSKTSHNFACAWLLLPFSYI